MTALPAVKSPCLNTLQRERGIMARADRSRFVGLEGAESDNAANSDGSESLGSGSFVATASFGATHSTYQHSSRLVKGRAHEGPSTWAGHFFPEIRKISRRIGRFAQEPEGYRVALAFLVVGVILLQDALASEEYRS